MRGFTVCAVPIDVVVVSHACCAKAEPESIFSTALWCSNTWVTTIDHIICWIGKDFAEYLEWLDMEWHGIKSLLVLPRLRALKGSNYYN